MDHIIEYMFVVFIYECAIDISLSLLQVRLHRLTDSDQTCNQHILSQVRHISYQFILNCINFPEQSEVFEESGNNEVLFIHSFSSLSYDRSKASSKASSPHSAIQSFLFQMRVSSPFLKVIQ